MERTPPQRDEMDFGELLRKPEKLFGYSYLYFLGALVLIGLMYGWHLTDIGKNRVVPLAVRDSSAYLVDIPFRSPQTIPPVDVMTAAKPTEEALARGRELYKGNCASCHGDLGAGDGPTAATLNPQPRNFLRVQGWTNGSTISAIYRTLEEGIVKNGMPSFNYLAPADRFALIHVVRAFASGHPVDTREQLQELEVTYELSKGRFTDAQIPVRKAVQILVREGRQRVEASERLAGWMALERDPVARDILRRAVADTGRVLAAFLLAPSFPPLSEFIATVSADPLTPGFRASVVQFSGAEWGRLYDVLNRLRETQGRRL